MKIFISLFIFINVWANVCDSKLFSLSTQGGNSIKLNTIITDLSDTCNLNVLIKDDIVKEKLKQDLKFIKLNNLNLSDFLAAILGKNGFFYTLKGDTLSISYVKTKNFKIDYINSIISGSTNFSASTTDNNGVGSNTLTSEFNFDFWKEFGDNINRILTSQVDTFFTNPLPIIDKTTGMVTITGTKAQLDRIDKYIKELNKRLHKEVMIDVKIYSVRLSKANQTGINWSDLSLAMNAKTALTGNVGQTILDSTSFSLNGLLNFLATYGQVNSISNPKITTLNNQKAIITVGQTINYSYKKVTNDANGNPLQEDVIDNKFVGILLDITPEISDSNIILMGINPSISSIAPTQLNPGLPPDTFEKKLNTIIRVKNGDTIILGGLITDEDTFTQNGVPILKEIPVLKYLFSYKSKISTREELVFVITPHIVDLNKKSTVSSVFKLPPLEDL